MRCDRCGGMMANGKFYYEAQAFLRLEMSSLWTVIDSHFVLDGLFLPKPCNQRNPCLSINKKVPKNNLSISLNFLRPCIDGELTGFSLN